MKRKFFCVTGWFHIFVTEKLRNRVTGNVFKAIADPQEERLEKPDAFESFSGRRI